MSETLKLTASESVTIVAATSKSLEVEAIYRASGKPPPGHWHPAQDEHFEVVEGGLYVRLGGTERDLAAGDTLDVPRMTVHQMWNPASTPARVRWITTPPGRTEQWFREIHELQVAGKTSRSGAPSPLAMGALLSEYSDVFRLAGPDLLLRPAVAGLGLVSRLTGNRPAHASDD